MALFPKTAGSILKNPKINTRGSGGENDGDTVKELLFCTCRQKTIQVLYNHKRQQSQKVVLASGKHWQRLVTCFKTVQLISRVGISAIFLFGLSMSLSCFDVYFFYSTFSYEISCKISFWLHLLVQSTSRLQSGRSEFNFKQVCKQVNV